MAPGSSNVSPRSTRYMLYGLFGIATGSTSSLIVAVPNTTQAEPGSPAVADGRASADPPPPLTTAWPSTAHPVFEPNVA